MSRSLGPAAPSHPITGTAVCCACAESGPPAPTPPSSVMNSRRFTAQYLPMLWARIAQHYCCAAEFQSGLRLPWVKTGKSRCEHMFSALPFKADIAQRTRHVRFVPNPDSCSAEKNLLDHLVGKRKQCRRNKKAERSGGLLIDH